MLPQTLQVQDESRRIITDRGVDAVSLQALIHDVTPYARQHVPIEVKREILELMKKFIEQKTGIDF